MMYLCFHIILQSRVWNSTNYSSSISTHISTSCNRIMKKWWKIIISSWWMKQQKKLINQKKIKTISPKQRRTVSSVDNVVDCRKIGLCIDMIIRHVSVKYHKVAASNKLSCSITTSVGRMQIVTVSHVGKLGNPCLAIFFSYSSADPISWATMGQCLCSRVRFKGNNPHPKSGSLISLNS